MTKGRRLVQRLSNAILRTHFADINATQREKRALQSASSFCEPLEKRVLLSYTFNTLANFTGSNGQTSESTLVADSSGNLYGTTKVGGSSSDGTVFEVAAGTNVLTTIATFTGANGANPMAGLYVDSSGNLFGTTNIGGSSNLGTVFEVATGTHTLTTLVNFTGAANGANPEASLIADASGNLYGTTYAGGANNDGTAFELASGTFTLTTLATFAGASNGMNPQAPLVFDSSGNLYGTTVLGGASSAGVAYEIATGTHALSTIATFSYANGSDPLGGMTIDASGNLFGVAQFGDAAGNNTGDLYEIAAGTHAFSILVTFTGPTNGSDSTGNLILSGGNLFGTSRGGSSGGDGDVFEYNISTAAFSTLQTFNYTNGASPMGLYMNAGGSMYGVTMSGGANGDGTVYDLIFNSSTPSQVVFTQQPTNTVAGSVISPAITVSVENSSGQVITSDNSNVTLAINSGSGTLSGTLTVAAVNGVATFNNISCTTTGALTLIATDGSLTSAVSGSFNITPAVANKLVFVQQPSNVNTGTAITPAVTVAVEDTYGNLVTSNNSSVTMAINAGPGSLGGTLTVAASGGIATFNNLTLSAGGTVSLKATDGSLTNAVSNNFTVAVGGASLSLTPSSTSVSPGGSISFTLGLTATGAGVANEVTGLDYYLVGSSNMSGNPYFTITTDDISSSPFSQQTSTTSPTLAANFPSLDINIPSRTGSGYENGVDLGASTPVGSFVANQSNVNVANFALSVAANTPAGTYTIGVNDLVYTDWIDGNSPFPGVHQFSGTLPTFTVTVGSSTGATQLAITQQPTNTAAGSVISPAITVAVENSSGQVVTTDNSNVTLAINSGSGALSGTLTVAAVNGIATFSNISCTTTGALTLKATDGTLTNAVSGSFNITPAAASKLAIVQQPTNATAGSSISPALTVAVEDAFGNVVTSNSSTVTMAINTGSGTLAGTLSVAAVNGIATFSTLSDTTAGALTLKATDGSLTSSTSNSFNVTPAAANKLAFVQQPTNVNAGTAITPAVTVAVEDTFGNVITSDSSSVTMAINSGPGTLSGTLTVAVSSGIATFSNLMLSAAGTLSLKATDGALTNSVSNNFTVSASSTATKVVFGQQPTNTVAGVSISPAVTVFIEDAGGNIVTTNNSTVTIAINTGSGTLAGTLSVAAVNGVATFSNLSNTTAGALTLNATDGALTNAVSNSFNITPAAASKLAFIQQPTNTAAGSSITPAVTVAVEDTFGNVVTSNSSTVTMAINTGSGTLGGTLSVAASSGIATFSNLSDTAAGALTLKATDGALTNIVSSSFNITPAPATKLAFIQQPTNVNVGAAITPAVTVAIEDTYGNVVTGNSSSVTMAISTGPGTLGGTLTVAAVNGVATFSNLTLSAAGTVSLVATDGALTSIVSNNITVGAVTYTYALDASFSGTNGNKPEGALVADSSGNLYGTTFAGGTSGDGIVFELAAGTHALSTLVNFTGTANGANPMAGLYIDSSGDLFGTTNIGGASNLGIVFEVAAGTHAFSTLVTFTGAANGSNPQANLIADSSGNLYGTASTGGTSAKGTAFEIAAGTNTLTTLATFTGPVNGANPEAPLVFDSTGNLYGTTQFGGSSNGGVAYKIASGTHALSILQNFSYAVGSQPFGGLAIDSSGNLYGTTQFGLTANDGVIFRIAAGTHAYTILQVFSGSNGSDPTGNLVIYGGSLFGTTQHGGSGADGTVFQYNLTSLTYTVLQNFNYTDGSGSMGLYVDANGDLFGGTLSGGTGGDGTIYELIA